jgi:molybdopterin-synthase adenylyltransferase
MHFRTPRDLARLHVGVVGAGSVGALVAEALARVGVERITLLDFDTVELINLDRLLHASPRDAHLARAKVEVLARALRRSATAARPQVSAVEYSVVEPEGLGVALDCDVLFSCVDRPWPRAVLNLAAYAHLIPVVDGGILVHANAAGADLRMRGAEWRAHLAAPGRTCLECLGQYDPALVQLERDGRLDDPSYLTTLPDHHPLRHNQNVFPFSAATAAAEVLQLLTAVVAPSGIADTGAHLYHFTTGTLDRITEACRLDCPYSTWLLARRDAHSLEITGPHATAQASRASRATAHRGWRNRISRTLDDLLWRLLWVGGRSWSQVVAAVSARPADVVAM